MKINGNHGQNHGFNYFSGSEPPKNDPKLMPKRARKKRRQKTSRKSIFASILASKNFPKSVQHPKTSQTITFPKKLLKKVHAPCSFFNHQVKKRYCDTGTTWYDDIMTLRYDSLTMMSIAGNSFGHRSGIVLIIIRKCSTLNEQCMVCSFSIELLQCMITAIPQWCRIKFLERVSIQSYHHNL